MAFQGDFCGGKPAENVYVCIKNVYMYKNVKLKLQYFGHLMQRADSFEKILTLGEMEGRRRRGQQRMRRLDGITNSTDMSLSNSGRE